ncbi:GNAT family N-acetyltransferase [Demequina mangrovi]|uniref:Predicted acetyltransferase, GNAT superfamily n=1 Tax=Demequina mangrovi TaxID=1043493 RepID=A0A1H6YUB4_9MICO|nr:GNAT family N-acetyltransferase [Demequina mangrovi]SEJ44868.1 Predicted acetyltransferase, GNAT superfamily [Demequina mangrovi]
MQTLRLRVMRATDISAVAELNAAASPAVNLLSEEDLISLHAMCDVALVATDRSRRIIAFLLSLGMGQPYESENYRWFEERGVRHQYIDRIVVHESAKGTGVGRALYESVFERARERGATEVTTEVQLDPPNPGSVTFHEHLGFQRVAEQHTRGGTVHVALLARAVY